MPHDKERFGVALHHATAGERDMVDGKRLAEVLGCRPGYPATSRRYAGPDAQRQVWALAVLVELEFLRWLRAELRGQEPPEPEIPVGQLLSRIRDHYPDQSWGVRSAKRQFERYVSDFMKLALLKQKSPAPRGFEARYMHWRDTPSAAVERIRKALQQLKDVELEPESGKAQPHDLRLEMLPGLRRQRIPEG